VPPKDRPRRVHCLRQYIIDAPVRNDLKITPSEYWPVSTPVSMPASARTASRCISRRLFEVTIGRKRLPGYSYKNRGTLLSGNLPCTAAVIAVPTGTGPHAEGVLLNGTGKRPPGRAIHTAPADI